jgi:hypothetical protein
MGGEDKNEMTGANDTSLLAEAEDGGRAPPFPNRTSFMMLSMGQGDLSLLSISSSSRHLTDLVDLGAQHHLVRLKKQVQHPSMIDDGCFPDRLPQAAAACLHESLSLANMNLTGRFPPSSTGTRAVSSRSHPVPPGESIEGVCSLSVGNQLKLQHLFCFFRAEVRSGGSARCRKRPTLYFPVLAFLLSDSIQLRTSNFHIYPDLD